MPNVVVTGGSRGIGLDITTRLVSAGYHVIVVARRTGPELDAAMRKSGPHISFVAADLSAMDSLRALGPAIRKFGLLYGLVNNAGVGPAGILTLMPDAEIDHVIRLNLISSIIITKYMSRLMMANGSGRVINISSIVARTGYQGLSAYSASKAGLEGFTRSLARELGPANITVNAIAPGFIDTEMTHGLTEKHRQQIANRSALKRMAVPADVAGAVQFLMSEDAANITGTVMTVDAGNTA